MKNQVVVIGTNPPCPRCKLLTDVITEKVKELAIDVEVVHWTFSDPEAIAFAKNLGLETGTASHVAQRLGTSIDHTKKQPPEFESEFNREYDDYNYSNWSHELDELLRPFENEARQVGILMTPAVVINNELIHQGSVPRMATLIGWLSALNG